MSDNQKVVDQFNTELKTLREFAEKGVNENLGAIKSLTESLSKHGEKIETAVKAAAAVEQVNKTNEKRIDELEAELKRGNFDGESKKEEEAKNEIKALGKLMAHGEHSFLKMEEAKYMRTDSQVDGGYLAPRVLQNKIIANLVEISPIRQIADVISIRGKSIELPKLTTEPTAYWVGEGATIDAEAAAKFGLEEIKAEKMGAFIDITLEMIEDGIVDLGAYLAGRVSLALGKLEGAGYVNGNSIKKPEGFMFNSSVGQYASGKADGLTGDCFLGIQGEFKEGYNLTAVMNRKTFYQHCLTLKGGDGQYLLATGINDKAKMSIAGLPVVIAQDMPDVGAGLFPVAVGDFREGYQIVDNSIIGIIEDNVTQALSGKKRWIFFKRTGGQVKKAEAIKKIKVATSL